MRPPGEQARTRLLRSRWLCLQPRLPTVAASITYGCSLDYLRLQPRLPTVVASITYGCSLDYLRLQPRLSTVAASITYGCSLDYLRLQVLDLVEGGNAAKSGLIQKGDQLVGVTG